MNQCLIMRQYFHYSFHFIGIELVITLELMIIVKKCMPLVELAKIESISQVVVVIVVVQISDCLKIC